MPLFCKFLHCCGVVQAAKAWAFLGWHWIRVAVAWAVCVGKPSQGDMETKSESQLWCAIICLQVFQLLCLFLCCLDGSFETISSELYLLSVWTLLIQPHDHMHFLFSEYSIVTFHLAFNSLMQAFFFFLFWVGGLWGGKWIFLFESSLWNSSKPFKLFFSPSFFLYQGTLFHRFVEIWLWNKTLAATSEDFVD